MKPNNTQHQSKQQNSLNDFLGKNSLALAPKQHIAYSKITFSPKAFLYFPKKNMPLQNSTLTEKSENIVDKTILTKSELFLNPTSPSPSGQLLKMDGTSVTAANGFYMYNPKTKSIGQNIFNEKNATTVNEQRNNTFYNDRTTEISTQLQDNVPKEMNNKKKKNLEIQTKFSYGRPLNTLKAESAQSTSANHTSKNWNNSGLYKSTIYTPQVSNSIQPIQFGSVSSTFNSTAHKELYSTKNKQEALIKTYASQDTRKRPVSSSVKPLSQIKNTDKAFPELNAREHSNKLKNDEANEKANQENIRLKYKLTRKDEGSFEIMTPKDNFTQLLSEGNKKAYDQQLREIKSTLKSMRIPKNLSHISNDLNDLKKPAERIIELNGKGQKQQQPSQQQETEEIKSRSQINRGSFE